ncbi:MAG: FIST C-terminal domain-containing protein [Candidatus Thermoplasmatota archaeon]|nr:FIST C-terminal domain-containing protein [Candidatus Thermoplasmatota archaeon]
MHHNCSDSAFNAAVGLSTNKGPREAGREAAESTLQKLRCKPDFFLLYATAEYEGKEEFQEILDGVWEILPEGTPLVGGMINGFLTSQGCYARGVVGLAVSYPHMDITIGYGNNTKRSPKKAAKQCTSMVKKGLKHRYPYKVALSIISGAERPSRGDVEDNSVVSSKIIAKIMLPLFSVMRKVSQIGFGTEEEILNEFGKQLPEFSIMHATTMNLVSSGINYQFIGKKVLRETAIVLAIEIDIPFQMKSATGAEKMDVTFTITKCSKDRRVIKEINYKPALPELTRLMKWSKERMNEVKYADLFSRHPLAFQRGEKLIMRPILMILGNSVGCLGKIKENEVSIVKMSPEKMIEAVDDVLADNNPMLGLLTSCVSRQSFLGIKVYKVQEKLKHYFQENPFLLLYVGGEGMCTPQDEAQFLNETITSTIFEKSSKHL